MQVRIRHSESRRALRADVSSYSAEAFGWPVANMLARRYYGRRGYARTCRLDSWALDGSCRTFEAFIGVPSPERGSNATVGHNIWFNIYKIEVVAEDEYDYDDEPVPDNRYIDEEDIEFPVDEYDYDDEDIAFPDIDHSNYTLPGT